MLTNWNPPGGQGLQRLVHLLLRQLKSSQSYDVGVIQAACCSSSSTARDAGWHTVVPVALTELQRSPVSPANLTHPQQYSQHQLYRHITHHPSSHFLRRHGVPHLHTLLALSQPGWRHSSSIVAAEATHNDNIEALCDQLAAQLADSKGRDSVLHSGLPAQLLQHVTQAIEAGYPINGLMLGRCLYLLTKSGHPITAVHTTQLARGLTNSVQRRPSAALGFASDHVGSGVVLLFHVASHERKAVLQAQAQATQSSTDPTFSTAGSMTPYTVLKSAKSTGPARRQFVSDSIRDRALSQLISSLCSHLHDLHPGQLCSLVWGMSQLRLGGESDWAAMNDHLSSVHGHGGFCADGRSAEVPTWSDWSRLLYGLSEAPEAAIQQHVKAKVLSQLNDDLMTRCRHVLDPADPAAAADGDAADGAANPSVLQSHSQPPLTRQATALLHAASLLASEPNTALIGTLQTLLASSASTWVKNDLPFLAESALVSLPFTAPASERSSSPAMDFARQVLLQGTEHLSRLDPHTTVKLLSVAAQSMNLLPDKLRKARRSRDAQSLPEVSRQFARQAATRLSYEAKDLSVSEMSTLLTSIEALQHHDPFLAAALLRSIRSKARRMAQACTLMSNEASSHPRLAEMVQLLDLTQRITSSAGAHHVDEPILVTIHTACATVLLEQTAAQLQAFLQDSSPARLGDLAIRCAAIHSTCRSAAEQEHQSMLSDAEEEGKVSIAKRVAAKDGDRLAGVFASVLQQLLLGGASSSPGVKSKVQDLHMLDTNRLLGITQALAAIPVPVSTKQLLGDGLRQLILSRAGQLSPQELCTVIDALADLGSGSDTGYMLALASACLEANASLPIQQACYLVQALTRAPHTSSDADPRPVLTLMADRLARTLSSSTDAPGRARTSWGAWPASGQQEDDSGDDTASSRDLITVLQRLTAVLGWSHEELAVQAASYLTKLGESQMISPEALLAAALCLPRLLPLDATQVPSGHSVSHEALVHFGKMLTNQPLGGSDPAVLLQLLQAWQEAGVNCAPLNARVARYLETQSSRLSHSQVIQCAQLLLLPPESPPPTLPDAYPSTSTAASTGAFKSGSLIDHSTSRPCISMEQGMRVFASLAVRALATEPSWSNVQLMQLADIGLQVGTYHDRLFRTVALQWALQHAANNSNTGSSRSNPSDAALLRELELVCTVLGLSSQGLTHLHTGQSAHTGAKALEQYPSLQVWGWLANFGQALAASNPPGALDVSSLARIVWATCCLPDWSPGQEASTHSWPLVAGLLSAAVPHLAHSYQQLNAHERRRLMEVYVQGYTRCSLANIAGVNPQTLDLSTLHACWLAHLEPFCAIQSSRVQGQSGGMTDAHVTSADVDHASLSLLAPHEMAAKGMCALVKTGWSGLDDGHLALSGCVQSVCVAWSAQHKALERELRAQFKPGKAPKPVVWQHHERATAQLAALLVDTLAGVVGAPGVTLEGCGACQVLDQLLLAAKAAVAHNDDQTLLRQLADGCVALSTAGLQAQAECQGSEGAGRSEGHVMVPAAQRSSRVGEMEFRQLCVEVARASAARLKYLTKPRLFKGPVASRRDYSRRMF